MTKTTFGWVLHPNASDAEGAKALQENNENFIANLGNFFNTIWVEDHFQWKDSPVVECWTALVYYAAKHPEYRFGPLVFGQSYRNPAMTAKMFATLSWLTEGNLVAGIGAGWKEDEYCEPRPNPAPPLLIAGGGEKLTLRVVAKYADWMNDGFCTSETYARKLEVLKGHCIDVGRDYGQIKKTYYAVIALFEDENQPAPEVDFHVVKGTPEAVTSELKEIISLGAEHIMIHFTDFPSTTGLDLFKEKVFPNL